MLRDLHVWRLGPGQVAAVASVATTVAQRGQRFYQGRLHCVEGLSHITVEVHGPQQKTE